MSRESPPNPDEERRLALWLAANALAPVEDSGEDSSAPAVPLNDEAVRRILAMALGQQPVGDPPRFLPPIEPRIARFADRNARAAFWVALVSLAISLAVWLFVYMRTNVSRELAIPEPASTPSLDPTDRIIDDADAGFHTTGTGWIPNNFGGFRGGHHPNSQGARSAFWTFDRLEPGVYRVFMTWSHHKNRPKVVPIRVLDGDRVLASFPIDQSILSVDLELQGAAWKHLGDFPISGGKLTVELDSTRSKPNTSLPIASSCSADAVLVRPIKK